MKRRKDGRFCKKITADDGTPKYFYSSANTERAAERDISRQIFDYIEEEKRKKYNFLALGEAVPDEHEILVRYSANEIYRLALKKHLAKFHECDIMDITPYMVQSLLDDMALRQYSYSMISKTKIVFGIVLNYAIVKKICL